MIDIRDLSVRFGGIKALDGLTVAFTAPVCGLVGPNGAGKTTLLNALSGFVQSGAGSIVLDGISLDRVNAQGRVRLGMRRTFQTEQIVADLSVWDNALALLDHLPVPRASRHDEIARVLHLVGLLNMSREMAQNLNLYQRRMLEFAKTLLGQPRLILLDEPGAGLNEAESHSLRELIAGVEAFCGAQVLLVDHDISLISACCAQTVVLDYGQCIGNGPTRQVLSEAAVRRAYLGQE
jgi:branched-chain amino acid transport system ATP-binding protein